MGEITLRKALDNYKTIHMPYRNFADRTRVEYQNDLKNFVEFLEKRGINHAKAVGLPIIERYIAHLEQDAYSSRTRKRKVVVIRSFLAFLYQEGYIHENLARRIIVPFAESTIPHILMQSECDRLRNACVGNKRDKAIIELFFQTGIKLSELTRLTLDDIELGERQSGFMRIRGGRGKKERVIPLNDKATAALNDYLDDRKAEGNKILFLNKFGEALVNRGVQKMLKKYLKKAEVGRATIQTLRHTFGAQHEAKGTSQKTILEVMGFKDPRSEAVYSFLARDLKSRELQENSI